MGIVYGGVWVIPTPREAEAGGLLELGQVRTPNRSCFFESYMCVLTHTYMFTTIETETETYLVLIKLLRANLRCSVSQHKQHLA